MSQSTQTQHKVVINLANKISGTSQNFFVQVMISDIHDVDTLKYVKLENTSVISSTTLPNLYIASSSLSLPFTFNSNNLNESTVVGYVPFKSINGSNFYSLAVAKDNDPIRCINIASVIKSGTMNIQLVNRDGTPATGLEDFTISLIFSEIP